MSISDSVPPPTTHPDPGWSDLQRRILRAIATNGPQSRADLSRTLGVMRSTVGDPVQALLAQGALRERMRPDPGDRVVRAGRPGKHVELDPAFCSFLGVDVGVGHVHVVRTDFQNAVVARARADMDPTNQDPGAVAAVARRLIAQVCARPRPETGIMVSLPGIVDRTGSVRRVPPLGWYDVAFAALLADTPGADDMITLDNDANVFSAAYLTRPGADVAENALFVWLDEGIGGAIVVNGRTAFGNDGFSGEIGHITVSPRAGQPRARLEDIAGRNALLARHADLGGQVDGIPDLLARHTAGQATAIQVLDEWATALAEGLSSLTSVLNPGEIVFGGPMTPVLEHALPRLRDLYAQSLMPGTPVPDWKVLPSDPDQLAIGCCLLLRTRMFDLS